MLLPLPNDTLISEPLVSEIVRQVDDEIVSEQAERRRVGLNELPKVPEAGGVTEVTTVGDKTSGAALAVAEKDRAAAAAA